jgi:GTPase SAR1 family protein
MRVHDGTELYSVEVLDTGGSKEIKHLRHQWLRNSDGLIIFYDISSKASLEWVRQLHKDILALPQSTNPPTSLGTLPIVLVGNKSDKLELRQVSKDQGHQLATELEALFYEISVKNNANSVTHVVASLLKEMRKQRGPSPVTGLHPTPTSRTPSVLERLWHSFTLWLYYLRSPSTTGSMHSDVEKCLPRQPIAQGAFLPSPSDSCPPSPNKEQRKSSLQYPAIPSRSGVEGRLLTQHDAEQSLPLRLLPSRSRSASYPPSVGQRSGSPDQDHNQLADPSIALGLSKSRFVDFSKLCAHTNCSQHAH